MALTFDTAKEALKQKPSDEAPVDKEATVVDEGEKATPSSSQKKPPATLSKSESGSMFMEPHARHSPTWTGDDEMSDSEFAREWGKEDEQ